VSKRHWAFSPLDGSLRVAQTSGRRDARGQVDFGVALLKQGFLPENVTPDYYAYARWRVTQRFISSTVHVFGTQALLLALGIKSSRLGAAAALSWVLKDALGKLGRIVWASQLGRRFDSDAKRWRFRSSLLYAMGNGLEMITYVMPSLFLVLATCANTLKQMSMLTSSATRNAIYKSFAGNKENIGDITAKGEAQSAVADLLGMLTGIMLCRMIGTSPVGMGLAYVILSSLDIFAIYQEIKSVCFKFLNVERTGIVASHYAKENMYRFVDVELPTPAETAKMETLFLSAPYLKSPRVFSTFSRAELGADHMKLLFSIYQEKPYMLVFEDETCRPKIILHKDATEGETLRSLLAFHAARLRLEREGYANQEQVLRDVEAWCDVHLAPFTERLRRQGWHSEKFMFSAIRRRASW